MESAPRRRRDPEGRRRSIVVAAAELIVEVGGEALTHRMVAARAEVPLGATTQYFRSLDDLRDAGYAHLIAEIGAQVASVRARLDERGRTPAVIAELLHESIADARAVRAEHAVATAAVFDPRFAELAQKWAQELVAILSPPYDEERATAAAVFIDGLLWHAQLSGAPLSQPAIESALTALLGPEVALT